MAVPKGLVIRAHGLIKLTRVGSHTYNADRYFLRILGVGTTASDKVLRSTSPAKATNTFGRNCRQPSLIKNYWLGKPPKPRMKLLCPRDDRKAQNRAVTANNRLYVVVLSHEDEPSRTSLA